MTQQGINNALMLKVGTILRGTYRIDSYLSSGGFGIKDLANCTSNGKMGSIKELIMTPLWRIIL